MGGSFRSNLGRSTLILLLLPYLAAAIGTALSMVAAADTPPNKALEHQIKAAMLYKFLSYVDWPESHVQPSAPYLIGVLGAPHIEQELREITANRTINDRPVEVLKLQRVEEIRDAHMVFLGRQARSALPALARRAHRNQFLVVTESDEGLPKGSTINLRMIDGRVGFDVSLFNAQAVQLRLSARLLSVAASVVKDDL